MRFKKPIWIIVLLTAIIAILIIFRGGVGIDPDYKAKFLSTPPSANKGQTISITLCTTNAATFGDAGNTSTTRIYIHTSATISGATEIGSHLVNALPRKAYTNWTGNVTIPTGQPSGQNYLIAVADKDMNVTEANDNNNTNSVPITIN